MNGTVCSTPAVEVRFYYSENRAKNYSVILKWDLFSQISETIVISGLCWVVWATIFLQAQTVWRIHLICQSAQLLLKNLTSSNLILELNYHPILYSGGHLLSENSSEIALRVLNTLTSFSLLFFLLVLLSCPACNYPIHHLATMVWENCVYRATSPKVDKCFDVSE